jgi:hypothetical protein
LIGGPRLNFHCSNPVLFHMNTITSSSPGAPAAFAPDSSRASRRSSTELTAAGENRPAVAARRIETENRAAALKSIDDLAGAQAAVALMRLALSAQPAEARAAQGSPSAEKSLRLLSD